jgi:hypothetical protein
VLQEERGADANAPYVRGAFASAVHVCIFRAVYFQAWLEIWEYQRFRAMESQTGFLVPATPG